MTAERADEVEMVVADNGGYEILRAGLEGMTGAAEGAAAGVRAPPLRPAATLATPAGVFAPDADHCQAARGIGACWGVITEKHRLIIFGRYPFDEQWRPQIATIVLVALLVASCVRVFAIASRRTTSSATRSRSVTRRCSSSAWASVMRYTSVSPSSACSAANPSYRPIRWAA